MGEEKKADQTVILTNEEIEKIKREIEKEANKDEASKDGSKKK